MEIPGTGGPVAKAQEAAIRTVHALTAGISDVVGKKGVLVGDTRSAVGGFGDGDHSAALAVTRSDRCGGTRQSDDMAGGDIRLGDTLEVDWQSDGRPPQVPLYGTDGQGRYVEFEFENVMIRPMINFDDSMGGVGFLTGKFEAGVMKLWGHRRHRAANREFLPFWVASDVETRSERLIRNRDEEPRPAPYFDPETDAELLTVTVHCTGNAFEIPYRDPKTGEKQLVYVDGIVLGRLVEMSEDFRTACVQHPNSPLLLVSCSAGTVGGDAHLLFANYIHGQGFTGDVWAGQGIMSINARGEMGIRTQVAPDGTMISPFSVIRATEKHNVVPWSAGTVE